MNYIIKSMNEIVVEMQHLMHNEIVVNSPQMKQQLEDMQRNMSSMISTMNGFLGNFEQIRKHREQISGNHTLLKSREGFQKGGYHVA